MSTNPINLMGHRRVLPVPEALDPREAALGRSRLYGLFACLTAAPDDCPTAGKMGGVLPAAGVQLPFQWDREQVAILVEGHGALSRQSLKRQYQRLFEADAMGSRVSLREADAAGAPVGTREEIQRIYDYFGHRSKSYSNCAPDHLTVELSFMQMLTVKEALAGEDSCDSYALAQLHFLGRHLMRWIPGLVSRATAREANNHYTRVLQALDEFLRADHAWRQLYPSRPGIH